MDLQEYWQQEKWFLGIVLLPIIIVALAYHFVIYPQLLEVEKTRQEINALSERTFSEEWFTNELTSMGRQVDVLEDANQWFDTRIVSDSMSEYSETGFRKLAEKSGLNVQKIKEQVVEMNEMRKGVITITLRGSYKNFMKYLSSIEKKRSYASVSGFSVKKQKTNYSITGMRIEYLKR